MGDVAAPGRGNHAQLRLAARTVDLWRESETAQDIQHLGRLVMDAEQPFDLGEGEGEAARLERFRVDVGDAGDRRSWREFEDELGGARSGLASEVRIEPAFEAGRSVGAHLQQAG